MTPRSNSIPTPTHPNRSSRALSLGVLTLLAVSGSLVVGQDGDGKKPAQPGVKTLPAKQYEAAALSIPGQIPIEEGGWTEVLGINDKGTFRPIVKTPEDGMAVIGGMNNRGTVVGVGVDLATGLIAKPVRTKHR